MEDTNGSNELPLKLSGKLLLNYVCDILDHPDDLIIDPSSAPEALRPLAETLAKGAIPDQLDADEHTLAEIALVLKRIADKQRRLSHDAYTDLLTGLPNNAGFERTITSYWKQNHSFVIAFVDIDNLKYCNDTFGHQEGNCYIRNVGSALTRALSPTCEVFRIGGDEFIVTTTELSEEALSEKLESCRTALIEASRQAEPMEHTFSYGCSFVDPSFEEDSTNVTADADRKMYRYKIAHKKEPHLSCGPSNRAMPSYFHDERVLETLSLAAPGRYFMVKDLDSGIMRFSMKAVHELGLPSAQMDNAEAYWSTRVHPDDRSTLKNELEDVFSGKRKHHAIQYRALDKDGVYTVFESRGFRLEETDRSPALFVGIMANRNVVGKTDPTTGVGDILSLEACLEECRESGCPTGLIGIEVDSLEAINHSYGSEVKDRLLSEVTNRLMSMIHARAIVHRAHGCRFVIVVRNTSKDETIEMLGELLSAFDKSFDSHGQSFELSAHGAHIHYGRLIVQPLTALDELFRRINLVKSKKDIGVQTTIPGTSNSSHRSKPHDGLAENVDELTGLRTNMDFIAQASLLRDASPERAWALVSIDLGNMSTFNQWHGVEEGNQLIQEIAMVLSDVEAEHDAVAGYWGQDDFSLLVPMSNTLLDSIQDSLCQVVACHDESLGFKPSMGVYPLFASDPLDFDCYARAVFANRQAKQDVRQSINFFRPSEYDQKKEELELLSDFQFALADGHIFPMFQPQVDIAAQKIIGAEALARWQKEDGSYVSPGKFIPALEKSGFIVNLDKHIWESTIATIAKCLKRGINPVPVSVNVSRIDIMTFDVADYLEHLIKHYKIPARFVKAEITETSFLENMEEMRSLTSRLQAIGVNVMMDDFGSGLSSLSMLKEINVDVIKLDGNFVPTSTIISDEEKGTNIMFSMLTLSNAVDMPLIVEGVEKAFQVRLLRELGAQYVQGFYFYRPMHADAFIKLLERESETDSLGLKKPSDSSLDD